jgi:hypothetical protein
MKKQKQVAAAIATFATNLENSVMMEDRKSAVVYLAREIGVANANQIADMFGLVASYYKANEQALRTA